MQEVLNEWTYRKARSTLLKARSPHQASELAASVAGYEAIKGGGGLSLDLASFEGLGSALVKARIARGWSQEKLARKLGMPKQQVQRYEASTYASVSLSRIPKIADALGLSFTGTLKSGSPPNRSFDLARMLAGFAAAEAVQAVERRLRLRGLKEVEARRTFDDLCETYYRLAPHHHAAEADDLDGIADRLALRSALRRFASQ
jgi:transcriptional regulator with XRE-family HTH domain